MSAALPHCGISLLYMEKGSRRPDGPALAQAVVRAAVNEARRRLPGLAIFAGGKSFGGRMTSQAQAEAPLPDVRGIAFLGFPLHPANKPSTARAGHLFDIRIPMLFLQGTRDALADPALIRQIAGELGERATLEMFPDADHSFHVPARSGRTDEQVRADVLDALADWMTRIAGVSNRVNPDRDWHSNAKGPAEPTRTNRRTCDLNHCRATTIVQNVLLAM